MQFLNGCLGNYFRCSFYYISSLEISYDNLGHSPHSYTHLVHTSLILCTTSKSFFLTFLSVCFVWVLFLFVCLFPIELNHGGLHSHRIWTIYFMCIITDQFSSSKTGELICYYTNKNNMISPPETNNSLIVQQSSVSA